MATSEPAKSVENCFPKAPIDIKINDLAQEPTPLRIIKFQKYIQQCAINIPIKGNTLGLLGAIINDTDYKSINNNVSWAPPTTPGTTPTMSPSTATAPATATCSTTDEAAVTAAAAAAAAANETNRILQFQQATRDHEKVLNTWTYYQSALTALRNLIVNNIDEDYIAEHNNALTGFRLVTPATLLNHIKINYGEVEPRQLRENEIALEAPWDASTPIVTLYKRIEDCKLFAEAGDEALSDKKILRSALLAIEGTGLYNLACDNWAEKPAVTKTWSNFKIFFTKESKKVKHHTTGSLGMQDATANALLQLNDAFNQQQQQIELLTTNRQPLQELPTNIDNSNNQNDQTINNVTDQSIELKALKEQVQALMSTINNGNNSNNNDRNRNNNNNGSGNSYNNRNNNNNGNNENQAPSRSRKATKNADVRAQGYDKEGYAITYCHTHGTSRNLTHTSCTCKYPGELHKKLATLSNKMGGSSNTNQKAPDT